MSKTHLAAKNRNALSLEGRQDAPRKELSARAVGIPAALISALFLGMTPIFGKQAILLGAHPLAVVAIRTSLAAGLLLAVMTIFNRRSFYVYPAGLFGCLLAGWINGLGSLFYYASLARINAGVGQLLYSLYPFFLVMWLLLLDRQTPGRLTTIRVSLAVFAVYLLTRAGNGQMDLAGVLMMLTASALYALHIPINQRVLYDMPAPTVTVYTLLAMTMVVVPAYFLFDGSALPDDRSVWLPIIGLTLVTFFSRLALFLGVKHLGGMQTALLGLSELLVTLFLAHFWLMEELSRQQWLGAGLLLISLVLVALDKEAPRQQRSRGILGWLRPPASATDIPWELHE